jgi:hypothetical protein
MTLTLRAIMLALRGGKYRVSCAEGRIFGPEKELQIKRHPGQDCPTVRLHVLGLPRRAYSVPAHKVIAYAIFGPTAFEKGVHVRHLDGDTENNRKDNLALGSPSDNERDKPVYIRHRSATLARASQPHRSFNARLPPRSIAEIRQLLASSQSPGGRVKRGVVKALAEKYRVSSSTISLVGKNKTWT